MTAPQEPLVMTLEEAMRETEFRRLTDLREKHGNLADVQVSVTEDGWWVFLNDDGKWNNIKEFGIGEWEAAFSYALGRKVVARDDAAELRAALAFAQSVIKSGESWSPTCDEIIGGALAATEEEA